MVDVAPSGSVVASVMVAASLALSVVLVVASSFVGLAGESSEEPHAMKPSVVIGTLNAASTEIVLRVGMFIDYFFSATTW